MKVLFVGAGPGDPDLLTVKARRFLEECRVCIYAGSLVSDQVLKLIPETAEKHDSAGMDLEQIVAVYEDAFRRGIDVLRLHSGDPSNGAIREQMNELDRLGIEYEVVPGISAFQAAASEIKTELTA
ncbi:MAG: cobalt-precorrin-4/precorrin-4 C(11)-methyltransferase [Deltaproteobacteria bacterium]